MNILSNTVQSSRLRPPSIFWPVIMILVGVLAIWLPIASSFGVARLLGWLMLIDGVFQLIHAFRSEGVGPVLWKVLVAVVYLIGGIYLLTHTFVGVAILTLALAIFFLVEGVVDVVSYFGTRTAGASYWMLVNGIVSIILAAMIWRHWPTGSMWVLGVLVGIGLLMTGTSRLMMALAIRSYLKQSDRETGGDLRAA